MSTGSRSHPIANAGPCCPSVMPINYQRQISRSYKRPQTPIGTGPEVGTSDDLQEDTLVIASLKLIGLSGAMLANRPGSDRGRCVGMFLDPSPGDPGSRLPSNVPAHGNILTIRAAVPCMECVCAWTPRGPCRAFEDGTIKLSLLRCPPAQAATFASGSRSRTDAKGNFIALHRNPCWQAKSNALDIFARQSHP
jgi:hypothetical protein